MEGLISEGEYNRNSKNTLEQAIAMLNKIGFAFTGFQLSFKTL